MTSSDILAEENATARTDLLVAIASGLVVSDRLFDSAALDELADFWRTPELSEIADTLRSSIGAG